MKRIEQQELNEIIEKHGKWLRGEEGGERADLSNADLSKLDMRGASLIGAYLVGAHLDGAHLDGASLDGASLDGASLVGAYLVGAHLDEASLVGASLIGAYLVGAHLDEASLVGASLIGAYLVGAHLDGAHLDGAKGICIPISCPSHGEFIGWKKVNKYIIKLKIPEDARRCSATTRKCRAEKAFVISIENIDGTVADTDKVINSNYAETVYKVGEMVIPDSFDENRWNECSHGIHFFVDREEAVMY